MNEIHPRFLRDALLASAIAAILLASGTVDSVRAQDSDAFVVAVLPFSSSDGDASEELQEEMIENLDLLGQYTLIAAGTVGPDRSDSRVRARAPDFPTPPPQRAHQPPRQRALHPGRNGGSGR